MTREPFPIGGVKAVWSGTCFYCDGEIRDTRVTRRGNDWVHVHCHQEAHE